MAVGVEVANAGSSSNNPSVANGHASTPSTRPFQKLSEERSDEDAQEKLVQVAVAVLQQAVDLVERSLVSDEQLIQVSKYIPGSTIGSLCSCSTLR